MHSRALVLPVRISKHCSSLLRKRSNWQWYDFFLCHYYWFSLVLTTPA